MKQRPNYVEDGITKKRGSVNEQFDEIENKSKSFWEGIKELLFGDSFLSKFVRVLLAFAIAWFVLYLSNELWFDKYPISVNDDWNFWIKTGGFFGAAALILMVSNAVFNTNGSATQLAFLLLFFVTVVEHYLPVLYFQDGKSIVYVNNRTGEIFQQVGGPIHHDAKSNRDYFLDPRTNDTCWNESPKNIEIVEVSDDRLDYNPPINEINYSASESTYTFTLKAGQTLDHWIVLKTENGKNLHFEILSDDYDYYLIFSKTEQYYGGPDVVVPNKYLARFFLRAGSTDQVIIMKLNYY